MTSISPFTPCDTAEGGASERLKIASKGGPKTSAGKNRSRRNALAHGLSASVLLDEIIGVELIERHRQRLHHEWQPSGPTQEILIVEMARHAAALDFATNAEHAVLRLGASSLATIGQTNIANDTDTSLAAAVTSEAIDRVTRYRRAHEKGFYHALLRLRDAKQATLTPPAVTLPVAAFADEAACEAYLLDRLRRPDRRCPHCGGSGGCWLPSVHRWECSECQRQVSVRAGTVMAQSPLPLTIWFALICAVVCNHDLDARELGMQTGIQRPKTVQSILKRIRAAASSPEASHRLADLDRLFRESQRGRIHPETFARQPNYGLAAV